MTPSLKETMALIKRQVENVLRSCTPQMIEKEILNRKLDAIVQRIDQLSDELTAKVKPSKPSKDKEKGDKNV